MRIYRYVILGGGVAAGYAAQEMAKYELASGELGIISADDTLPYNRPPLSKAYLAGKKNRDDILINPPDFYKQHGIEVLLDTMIERVDLDENCLFMASGEEIQFEKLLVATGSRVRKLNIPKADLDGIHYLRWREDSQRIREHAQQAKRVVLVGGGYIGMEVSAVLAGQGLDVTVVFPEERLMERLFTPPMSAFFQKYYEEHGVKFISQAKAVAFTGDRQVSGVILDTREQVETNFVVAGIGVMPALELFEDTDLHIDEGIVLNKYLESNLSHIFAAGDVGNYYDVLFQKQRRIEHWDNAVEQGKHAARLMMGKRSEFQYVPYFFSDMFDLSYEFWGETESADQVIHRGDVASGSFSVWWLAEQRLVGAFVMNRPDEERELAPEWIRFARRPLPQMLMDETQSLKDMEQQLL